MKLFVNALNTVCNLLKKEKFYVSSFWIPLVASWRHKSELGHKIAYTTMPLEIGYLVKSTVNFRNIFIHIL